MIYTVKGNSMQPFLKNGDKVEIEPHDNNFICGKCYVFKYNKKLYIHRLTDIKKEYMLFMGDNTASYELVIKKNIVGEAKLGYNKIRDNIIKTINLFYFNYFRNNLLAARIRIFLIKFIFKFFKYFK